MVPVIYFGALLFVAVALKTDNFSIGGDVTEWHAICYLDTKLGGGPTRCGTLNQIKTASGDYQDVREHSEPHQRERRKVG